MEKTDNKGVVDYQGQLRERMGSKYPDRRFSAPEGASDGTGGTDDLYQAVIEALDEYDAKIEANTKANTMLKDRFFKDPRAGSVMNKWNQTGDFFSAMVEEFGDDFKAALETEEGKAKFLEANKKWLEKKTAEEALSTEANAAFEKSLSDLSAFGEKNGLDDEAQLKIMARLREVAENAIKGVYKPEDFQMVYDAGNYATDVENARKEGQVAGRNEKIVEQRRQRQEAGVLPPSIGSGATVKPGDKKPVNPAKKMFGLK